MYQLSWFLPQEVFHEYYLKKHEFIFILKIFYSVQSQQYHLFVCSTDSTCNLESKSRKCCKKCRFEKCLNIGMRPSWVLTPEERCQRMLQRCFCFLFCNSCRSKHSFGVLGWISQLILKQPDLLKIFELFFCTLWQAYLNICLCFGYTNICWPIEKVLPGLSKNPYIYYVHDL